jgi:hypothetical protein
MISLFRHADHIKEDKHLMACSSLRRSEIPIAVNACTDLLRSEERKGFAVYQSSRFPLLRTENEVFAVTGYKQQPSFVDGIGSRIVFPQMLERAQRLIDGALVAELDEVKSAIRLMAERNRIIAEGAGACALACTLAGKAGGGRVVCIVSGGNIDSTRLCEIVAEY